MISPIAVEVRVVEGVTVDAQDFDALIGPLIVPAYNLAMAMLGRSGDAEDAVQEAAVIAWRRLHQLRSTDSARPWFFTIVANRCRTARRTRWWGVVRSADPPSEAKRFDVDNLALSVDVERALGRLGMTERSALYLYFFADLPLAEVATVLGKSLSGTKSCIYRALRKLKPDLEDAEELLS